MPRRPAAGNEAQIREMLAPGLAIVAGDGVDGHRRRTRHRRGGRLVAMSDDRRRWVLHVDLDQFIAAVEVLRHPELAGMPLIVGGRGDPTERAVVSTASYEAREFGVGSGMPLRIAARKAPDAVILPVDAAAYTAASEEVMATLRAAPGAIVQVLGWDEAFIGIATDDPERYARGTCRRRSSNGPPCTAASASETRSSARRSRPGFGKPRGVFRLTADNWMEVMGARPTIELWGVGTKVSRRLEGLGIRTVADLAVADEAPLVAEFGPRMGLWYRQLGRGDGSSVVDDTPWVARGHSRETTFQQDLTDPAQVDAAVRELLSQVLQDVAAEGRPVIGLTLKVRYAPFFTKVFTKKIPATFDRDDGAGEDDGAGPEDGARPPDPAARRPRGDVDARRRPRGPLPHAQRLVSASAAAADPGHPATVTSAPCCAGRPRFGRSVDSSSAMACWGRSASRRSVWSSQRSSASAAKIIESTTSAHASSSGPAGSVPAYFRGSAAAAEPREACRSAWMTAATSTPGSVAASASLIASSSRVPWPRSTGDPEPRCDFGGSGSRDRVVDVTLLVGLGPSSRDRPARDDPACCRSGRR